MNAGDQRRKVLLITNLFCYPWDSNRGVFNQQQFAGLQADPETALTVLVAVPWMEGLKNFRKTRKERLALEGIWTDLHYFLYFYPPRFAYRLHPLCFLLSMLVQHPLLLLAGKWDCLMGSWLFPDAIATSWLGKLRGIPVFAKAHGSDVNTYLGLASRRSQILAAIARCQGVLSVSEDIKSQLVAAGVPAAKVRVIYNGVDHERFSPGERDGARLSLGLSAQRKLIIFVGNLKASKGVDDLIEAAEILQKQEEFQLVFLGDSPDRAKLQSRIEALGLSQNVSFAGKIPHRQMMTWFSAADLLCLPSHAEGVPNVVLEAMSSGLPVVASRVGGIPEVLPDFAGVLVESKRPELLAAALKRALHQSWDRAAIRHHAQRFSWRKNLVELKQFIQDKALK